jgi:hypothetical protein
MQHIREQRAKHVRHGEEEEAWRILVDPSPSNELKWPEMHPEDSLLASAIPKMEFAQPVHYSIPAQNRRLARTSPSSKADLHPTNDPEA